MIKKKIVIATGGIGGHVFPAYILANNLKNTFSIKLISDNRGSFYLKDYNNLNLIKIPSSPLIKKIFLLFFIHFLLFRFQLLNLY